MTPALEKTSKTLATKLKPLATPSAAADPISAAQLADPVALDTTTYRPLPDHSALGLSAFYVALLAIMSVHRRDSDQLVDRFGARLRRHGARAEVDPTATGPDRPSSDVVDQMRCSADCDPDSDRGDAADSGRTARHVRAQRPAAVAPNGVRCADDRVG